MNQASQRRLETPPRPELFVLPGLLRNSNLDNGQCIGTLCLSINIQLGRRGGPFSKCSPFYFVFRLLFTDGNARRSDERASPALHLPTLVNDLEPLSRWMLNYRRWGPYLSRVLYVQSLRMSILSAIFWISDCCMRRDSQLLPGMRVTSYTFVRVRILMRRLQTEMTFVIFPNGLWRESLHVLQDSNRLLYSAVLIWRSTLIFNKSKHQYFRNSNNNNRLRTFCSLWISLLL